MTGESGAAAAEGVPGPTGGDEPPDRPDPPDPPEPPDPPGSPADGAGWRALFPPWRRHGRPPSRHRRGRHRAGGEPEPTPPEPVTAFVLAGGGSRGAVQVGMLAELTARGIIADRVYGASVGAVNGAAYAGDPTPQGVTHLQEVWINLTGNDVFPRGRMDGPWMFFQQRQSVHPNSGLRTIVENGIRFERLEDAPLPLEVVATSLADGRERWLTEGPAVDAILASAAIPAIFPPVVIDGDTLIDGGVVNNVPLSRALEGGATRIYVLLCGPLHYRPREPRRPVEAVLSALFVAVNARFARELAQLPPGVEVVVFSGGGEPASAYRDFSGTHELIAQGRAEVAATLDGVPRAELEAGPVVVPPLAEPAEQPSEDGAPSGDDVRNGAAAELVGVRGRWNRRGRAPDDRPVPAGPVEGDRPTARQDGGGDGSGAAAGDGLASSRTAPQAIEP